MPNAYIAIKEKKGVLRRGFLPRLKSWVSASHVFIKMAYYVVEEWAGNFLMGLFVFFAVIALFTLKYNRRYTFASLKQILRGNPMVLVVDPTGGPAGWSNVEKSVDWLKGGIGNYHIISRPILAEQSFYLLSLGFGFSVDSKIAAAVSRLKSYGFHSLESAVSAFDEAYLNDNREAWKEIEAEVLNSKGDLEVAKEKFLKVGREKLINFVYFSPFCIDLATVFNAWSVQVANSQDNRIITDSEVLEERRKALAAQKGIPIEKLMAYVVMVVMLIMAGALAYNMIGNHAVAAAASSAASTITTTTMP